MSCSHIQYLSLLFFLLAHKIAASLNGHSSTGGPSMTILNSESNVCSVILFRTAVLISLTVRMFSLHLQSESVLHDKSEPKLKDFGIFELI